MPGAAWKSALSPAIPRSALPKSCPRTASSGAATSARNGPRSRGVTGRKRASPTESSSRSRPPSKPLDKLLKQELAGQLDMAFIDADKTNYDNYYERCLKLVRQGGAILIDNVLWGGSVANLADKDADTEAIRKLNAKLQKDDRIDLTLFSVGDGMTCAVKR
ncbi:MAG TPA: hypothetical protein VFB13_13000 [Reyranella sp.]|nr:hypothetical protein [Reyranella sp.]